MRVFINIFIITLLISCSSKQKKETRIVDSSRTAIPASDSNLSNNSSDKSTEIIETFSDSVNIGKKGENKIEIIKHSVFEDTYVIVKFYTKGLNTWYLENTYLYECDALMGLDPIISDFNNDKLNDITFISATAARGANEVRRLFIYDKQNNGLISILNSQDFPNMEYNKDLNCIDAFLVYGGTSTVFARIKGDSLKEFARVENDNYRTVYEMDKNGNELLIRKDTILDMNNVYVRYKNYKPLIEYKK